MYTRIHTDAWSEWCKLWLHCCPPTRIILKHAKWDDMWALLIMDIVKP